MIKKVAAIVGIIAFACMSFGAASKAEMNGGDLKPKKKVDVAVKGIARATWTVDPTTGIATTEQVAIFSHLGLTEITGTAFWGPYGPTLPGEGETIAANGDRIFWELAAEGPYSIVFTGGTGRFSGVSGGLNIVWQTEPVVTVDPDTGTMTVELEYASEGMIIYEAD